MNIEWQISKQRGNVRPVLTYKICLEDFEKELILPQVIIESNIPEPPYAWSASCLPDERERSGEKCGKYRLYTPDHKVSLVEGKLTLPWRDSSSFPEVEESFKKLRDDFEKVLKQGYDSLPFEERGKLGLSDKTREHIASGLVAERFLSAVGF